MARKDNGTAVEKSRPRTRSKATAGIPPAARKTRSRKDSSESKAHVAPRAQSGTTRKDDGDGRAAEATRGLKGVARKVGTAIRRAGRKVLRKSEPEAPVVAPREHRAKAPLKAARPAKRESDIPLDAIAQTYTPRQTSLKASFRADGNDQHRDQEFASGRADDVWNDEDRFTNKSGDPRIGTHNRTYEAGERHRGSKNKD